MKTPSFSLALLASVLSLAAVGTAFAAPPGTGSITGTVTESGGNRLPNICVDVSDGQGTLAGTETNTAGEYAFNNLPAGDTVIVEFHDCSNGNWAQQWFKGASTEAQATQIVVPDGGTRSAVDATMLPGVRFSGTVTDSSGTPIPGVCVFIGDPDHTHGSGSNPTDSNGHYSAEGLQPGTYIVDFDSGCHGPGNYAEQWYDGATSEDQATQLTGTAGQSFTGIDAQLQATQSSPPVITGVSPNSGPTSGGTEVTITGTNLTNADTVKFGVRSASQATAVSPTEIDAIAPAEDAGTVDITVTSPTGTSAINDNDHFTYDPSQPALVATVTSVSPTTGPTSGGGYVTIDGDNLGGAYEVDFGNAQSPEFSTVSNNELQARVPAHDAGTVHITVVTRPLGSTANTPADAYTYGDGIGPQLPESPLALLLPVAGLVATTLVLRRRRRHLSTA